MGVVLGLHGGFTIGQHEPGAALLIDGETVSIYEEERFNRIKSSYGLLPKHSVQHILNDNSISPSDVDLVVVSGTTYSNTRDRWKLFLEHIFGCSPQILVCHHQEAHAAAAFYGSGYDKAVAITLDAYGDKASGSIYICDRLEGLKLVRYLPVDESLGVVYTAFTYHLGFEEGDEYKVMGLAPYGQCVHGQEIFDDISASMVKRTHPDVISPFDYPCRSDYIQRLTGVVQRPVNQPLSTDHQDLAKLIQEWLEQKIRSLFTSVSVETGISNIVYAGGVALNCAANRSLRSDCNLDRLYISPLSSDRGLAYGCACIGSASMNYLPTKLDVPYYGKLYLDSEIESELTSNGVLYSTPMHLTKVVARLLHQDKIVGWFHGKSEAGARALGNRSILASASKELMKDLLNSKIKYRESFRPFAPIVLENDADMYWHIDNMLDYSCMTYTALAKDLGIQYAPASIHADKTSRLQTINPLQNPLFSQLLSDYKELSGHSILLNTSFNLKGQPIVESPRDALMTFYGCGLDALVMGPYLILKDIPQN